MSLRTGTKKRTKMRRRRTKKLVTMQEELVGSARGKRASSPP